MKSFLWLFIVVTLLVACTPSTTPQIVEVTVLVTQPPLPTYIPYPTYTPYPPYPTYTPYPTCTPLPGPTSTPKSTATPTLEVVEPADARASAYVGGNASPPLPVGELGVLSMVAIGSYDGSSLPVVVRNNTREDVVRVTVSAMVRNADGNMLGTGGDQGFNPNLVRPGEITLGYVYFGGIDLPADVTFEFEVGAKPASEARYENIRDLDVIEQSFVEDRIVGMLQNSHNEHVSGPFGVYAVCFNTEGVLLSRHHAYTDKDEANPGDTVPFQVGVRGPCPVFLVAAYGFAD